MKCNHCPREDETVRQYDEMGTGVSDLMCDTCYFFMVPFNFAGTALNGVGEIVDEPKEGGICRA
jgi:hypothetical protein